MLKDTIQQDLTAAMLAHDESKVSALRMLISEIRYAGNGRDADISDEAVLTVIQKEIKKRKESAQSYRQGGREDLASKEESEIKVYEAYLPEQISDEELTKLVDESINELGAQTMQDMGRVMGAVRQKVGSGADPSRISEIVKAKLS